MVILVNGLMEVRGTLSLFLSVSYNTRAKYLRVKNKAFLFIFCFNRYPFIYFFDRPSFSTKILIAKFFYERFKGVIFTI